MQGWDEGPGLWEGGLAPADAVWTLRGGKANERSEDAHACALSTAHGQVTQLLSVLSITMHDNEDGARGTSPRWYVAIHGQRAGHSGYSGVVGELKRATTERATAAAAAIWLIAAIAAITATTTFLRGEDVIRWRCVNSETRATVLQWCTNGGAHEQGEQHTR